MLRIYISLKKEIKLTFSSKSYRSCVHRALWCVSVEVSPPRRCHTEQNSVCDFLFLSSLSHATHLMHDERGIRVNGTLEFFVWGSLEIYTSFFTGTITIICPRINHQLFWPSYGQTHDTYTSQCKILCVQLLRSALCWQKWELSLS